MELRISRRVRLRVLRLLYRLLLRELWLCSLLTVVLKFLLSVAIAVNLIDNYPVLLSVPLLRTPHVY